jgi:hypothetical protein
MRTVPFSREIPLWHAQAECIADPEPQKISPASDRIHPGNDFTKNVFLDDRPCRGPCFFFLHGYNYGDADAATDREKGLQKVMTLANPIHLIPSRTAE